jgi:hypothetical protein
MRLLAVLPLLIGLIFTSSFKLNAQEIVKNPEHYQTRPSPHFKPNKGQVADHEGNLIKAYEYVYQAPGMKVGLNQNGFHYNLYTVEEKAKPDKKVSEATGKPANAKQQPERPSDKETEKQTTYHYHRVEVEFKGANEAPEIIAGKQMDYYANYYLGYLPEYVTKVHGYRKLTYKNLYDNIDLVLRPATAENGRPKLKYNIRVRPGGDLSDVKLVYKGMDKLSLKNGKLQIATSQGRMTETIPKSYWAESKEATTVNYQLEGNTVSFQAEQEQEEQTLVVDPSLSWSTYLGGNEVDEGKGVATDESGNVYATGLTASITFPTTGGAFQASIGGEIGAFEDAFLTKFTSNGTLSWSTFIGGSSSDEGNDVATSSSGKVYVAGNTNSTDFPVTNSAYQPSFGGGGSLGFLPGDAFLGKFAEDGSISWNTYLGGRGSDDCKGLATDENSNVFVTGNTTYFDSNNFPVTSGAYQKTYRGGDDAFITKFTSGGSLSWSTFVGGEADDVARDVTTGDNGNVYMTGEASITFPTTNGAHQSTINGNKDAFLCKFTNSGIINWSTFIGGGGNEGARGVATDGTGNVYITGSTDSIPFPTTKGAYQDSNQGDDDAFLSKFTISGALSWSTYLGGRSIDKSRAVTTDEAGNVYVIGETISDSFPTTNMAYQDSSSAILDDAFLSKFGGNGDLSYSTYLGGSPRNKGVSIATVRNGAAYCIGFTSSEDFPASNAYQDTLKNSIDAFLTKFNFNSVGTGTDQLQSAAIGLKAYPNPASNAVTLSYELPAAQSQVTLVVVDEQGKVIIRKEQGRQPAGRHTHQLQSLQEASPGTYFIRLKLGDEQQVERVVKVE